MSDEIKPFYSYIQALQRKLAAGDATEHTHRSALETLVESLVSGITATRSPNFLVRPEI